MANRIHILGAAGSGCTTLASALAARHGWAHFDADDYYWLPSDPPYRTLRPVAGRLALLRPALEAAPHWTLSGSICGWGDPLVPLYSLVVLLEAPAELRLDRIRERDVDRFGAAALAPGGAMHEAWAAFVRWAARYDVNPPTTRSRALHETWIARLPCPVLRLDAAQPVAALADRIDAAL